LLQVFSGIMVLSTLWTVVGFSLTFGSSRGGFIGNPIQYPLLSQLPANVCLPQAPNIPGIIYALFQMMFATITPLLQTGSFAGRLQFRAYLIYVVVWEIIVYYPLAHWIWGEGWLSPYSDVLFGDGVYDFAGGIVMHTSAGVGSLMCALALGPRHGFSKHRKYAPSNLGLATLGATFLWLGWFGLNGGSALSAGSSSAIAVINTQIAASVSSCIWLALSWKRSKPSLADTLNGAIAGLAGITPASGFVSTPAAFILGIIFGFVSYIGVYVLKEKLLVDDALDVTIIHGLTGIIGSLAVGFVATTKVNPNGVDGWIEGFPVQIAYQLLGVVVAILWSGIWSILILYGMKKTIGIRVSRTAEDQGLDQIEHGEEMDLYLRSRRKSRAVSDGEFPIGIKSTKLVTR